MTMTVPSMGQLISGVSVTKTSMVTTSDPAVRAQAIIHRPIWLTVPPLAIPQAPPMPLGVLHLKSIIIIIAHTQDLTPTPIATSACPVAVTIPIRIRVAIEMNTDQEIHIISVTTLTMKKTQKMITYPKER